MNREEIFEWVRLQYGTEPDYPFGDEKAVLRHNGSRKWYAVFMEVSRKTLGLPGEGTADIVNVKSATALVGALRTQPGYLPAYHMNKENWITILLDGTVPAQEIRDLLDLSYSLTGKKNKQYREQN